MLGKMGAADDNYYYVAVGAWLALAFF